jgi:3-oxoacyl-[acyl-carrier-protein] synthase-3
VTGLGTALPSHAVANDVVGERIGVDDAWIRRRTGIAERRRLKDGERLVDLATDAARAALADAGLAAEDLDLVVAATTAPDDVLPNLAPLVAAELGAGNAGAFDIGAACTGFLSALPVGASAIESGRAERVLVLGADAMSRLVDPDDRVTAALFGDGAGAVVLGADGDGWVGPVVLGADGTQADLVAIPRSTGTVVMDGHGTYQQAIRKMHEATGQAVAAAGLLLEDIDLFVYHQANRRILQALAERLGVDPDRVVDAIAGVGNTSAASLPLALEQARRDGQLRPGARVLLGAVGSGLCWGAGVVVW